MAPRKPKVKHPEAGVLKDADEGYQLARKSAVKYLHGRRQAMFSLARNYHLDADDLHQEAYEVLLTCLRDFQPLFTKADGEVVSVQFNTFFGNRLESKALEMRNRDPEYQARQAHTADMSEADRTEFRKNPPLLVQHLDQETALQEVLRGEVSSAQRSRQVNVGLKLAQDAFMERRLNELIAAERDDKRRAALQHIKAGGVSSFEEIAYHFGVTDSRASQILNELMDAFYTQRLIGGDLKSVVYDFRKLGLNDKRAQRLLEEAVQAAPLERANAIAESFGNEFPDLRPLLALKAKQGTRRPAEGAAESEGAEAAPAISAVLTAEEEAQFPLVGLEMREVSGLTSLGVDFRPISTIAAEDMPHIRHLLAEGPDHCPPILITSAGAVVDGERRVAAARAGGHTRLLCQVRQSPSVAAAHELRVVLNSRVRPLDKVELYFAICALLVLGLSQGKIAERLGTSRPNVIVYAKVREKASPRLRQLFEDGLVQITNASSAVDLPVKAQDELADFIRQYGMSWGRGPQFAEAYAAAAAGNLAALAPSHGVVMGPSGLPRPGQAVLPPMPVLEAAGGGHSSGGAGVAGHVAPHVAQALKKRHEALETALQDADVWARQREATIASQTGQIQDLRQQVEGLKREIEAHNLLTQADEATLANYMKDIKAFYALQERLAAGLHQLESAQRQLRSQHLTHRQTMELHPLLDKIAAAHTALRVQTLKTSPDKSDKKQ